MEPELRLGLRGQLLLVLAGVLALTVGLLALQWHNEVSGLRALRAEAARVGRQLAGDRLQAQGLAEAQALAARVAPALASGDDAAAAVVAARARAANGVVYVLVFDADGRLLDGGEAKLPMD